MQIYIKTTIAVFVGVVLAVLALDGLYGIHQDHVELQQVVSFLNSQLKAQQSQNLSPKQSISSN